VPHINNRPLKGPAARSEGPEAAIAIVAAVRPEQRERGVGRREREREGEVHGAANQPKPASALVLLGTKKISASIFPSILIVKQ
jgi:hypothetical protein